MHDESELTMCNHRYPGDGKADRFEIGAPSFYDHRAVDSVWADPGSYVCFAYKYRRYGGGDV